MCSKTLIRILILFVLFFSGKDMSVDKNEKILNKHLAVFLKEMKKKGLIAVGIGGSNKDNKVKQVFINFDIKEDMDVNFARTICLTTANEFLSYINSIEGLKNYFANYPFTSENISFVFIGNSAKIKNFQNDQKIMSACIENNKIDYCVDSDDGKMFIRVLEEDLGDAQKALDLIQ